VVKSLQKSVQLVVRNANVHASESLCKFVIVNKLVVVLIKLLKQIDYIALQVRIVLRGCFNLSDD